MSTEFSDLIMQRIQDPFSARVLYKAVATKLNKPRVLGVLGGNDFPSERLKMWAETADQIFAADGGANLLRMVGITPLLTLGDLDSIEPESAASQLELIHIADQDSSDCDKLLAYVSGRGIEAITLICVEGDLVDHLLGSLFSATKSDLEIRLALRRGTGHILRGPVQTEYSIPKGSRLSLLPISDCSEVSLEGTEWQLDQAEMSTTGLSSLSNKATGRVKVSMSTGTAVLIASHPDLETPHWE